MKRTSSILLLIAMLAFGNILYAQMLDDKESALLNEHFESTRGEFDFTGKQVGFFLSTKLWTKEEFFNDLIDRSQANQSMSNQFIVLTDEQKENSGGYDVFIYSWSKIRISKKQVGAHIEKLKKNEAQQ